MNTQSASLIFTHTLLLALIAFLPPPAVFSQTNTWTGATDRDWHKTCNWSLNLIPACTHDVVIPNTTNKPLVTGIAHCHTIDVASASGAYMEVASASGGIVYVSSTNGGACSGTATNNGGCCTGTVWGASVGLSGSYSGYGITVDATGVYSCGFQTPASPANGNEWYIQKRDLSGTFITAVTPAISTGQDIAYRILSDGTYLYIIGRQNANTNWRMEKRPNSNIATLTASATSAVGGTANGIHDAVIDGSHMYVIGFDPQSGTDYRWRIEKRNLSNCTLATTWTRNAGNNVNNPDLAYGVAIDATHIYVVGLQNSVNNDGMWRMEKISKSTGVSAWTVNYDPNVATGREEAMDVAVDATGVYVAGRDISNNLIIQKRDLAAGTSVLWTQTLSGVTLIGGSYANLAVDNTGLYVTNTTASSFGTWSVTKLNLSTGSILCTSTGGGNRASDIAVVNGKIYVMGSVPSQFRVEEMCCQ